MTRTLHRPCLDCGKQVRGKPRCRDCQRPRDQAKDQAKHARRPDLNRNAEIERRRRAVADHRAEVGDWCPGVPELGRGAHPAASLTADHLVEVAAGGLESGPLVVRCGSCNSARSANVGRVLTSLLVTTPSPGERPITHCDGDDPGPVAA
jgi:5-methylcytosine-specific restriction enzyme A